MQRIITRTTNTNVLVVDDNEVNLLIAKTTLESYAINVSVAASGAEALEKAGATPDTFDLVILDCIMPEMDGHETARRMRELGIDTKIVAYTANSVSDVLRDFADVGVQDVLLKPLNTIELTKVLLKYLPDAKLPDKEQTLKELALLGGAAPVENKKSALAELLEKVPELDFLTGLHYSADNEENYINVLRAAQESMRANASSLGAFAEIMDEGKPLSADETKQFRVITHSMKGVCASIGIDPLSKTAAELEKAAIDNPDGVCISNVATYAEALYKAGSALLSSLEEYDASKSPEPARTLVLSAEAFNKLLADTAASVKLFDIDAIAEGLKTLHAAARSDSERDALKTAIDSAGCFDYKKVAETLATLQTA